MKQNTQATLGDTPHQLALPEVRFPVRYKITFPYTLLALVFAMAAAYLISRYVLESIQDRFARQLADAGGLAADWMVQEESRLLETLRLVAHTRGLADAVTAGNAERLRELALPVAANQQEEAVEILDLQGKSVLSLRHVSGGQPGAYDATRGDDVFAQWDSVRHVLNQQTDPQGDKFAQVVQAPWGHYFYVVGPIFDDSDRLVGVVLIGKSLPTLAREIRQDTLAQVTLYDLQGNPIVSTLFVEQKFQPLTPAQAADILGSQDRSSPIRDLTVVNTKYSEVLGPWEARGGEDLGLVGSALAQTALVRPTLVTRGQAFVIVALAFLLVIGLGVYLANHITGPLMRIVGASAEVARGNLEVNVKATGNDELALLAGAFNNMVVGLRERERLRDLFGRYLSREVSEAVLAGRVSLQGERKTITVLYTDMRGSTAFAEAHRPEDVMAALNEYFEVIILAVESHGGIINRFVGDEAVCIFGAPREHPDHAERALLAALAMREGLAYLNRKRSALELPTLKFGIGLNTGDVVAGATGSDERQEYTLIGEAMNVGARIEQLNKTFPDRDILLSEFTHAALGARADAYTFADLGAVEIRGKSQPVRVYGLVGTK